MILFENNMQIFVQMNKAMNRESIKLNYQKCMNLMENSVYQTGRIQFQISVQNVRSDWSNDAQSSPNINELITNISKLEYNKM